MATRDAVYIEFGRAAELAQLLEKDLGTALLALDGIKFNPNADTYLRLRDSIDKQTLGASLKQIRARLNLSEDVDAVLQRALDTRNLLAHRFFLQHDLDLLSPAGCEQMTSHLLEIQAELRPARALANHMADMLVRAALAQQR